MMVFRQRRPHEQVLAIGVFNHGFKSHDLGIKTLGRCDITDIEHRVIESLNWHNNPLPVTWV